jgi:hypothetical protein
MNITMAAVGIDPGLTVGGGCASGALAIAAFAAIGLILLFAAGRLMRRRAHGLHNVR